MVSIETYIEEILNKNIPEDIDIDSIPINCWELREKLFTKGIWSLVTMKWVREIAQKYLKGKRVLEIMGGTGLLTKAIADTQLCKEVFCTDNYSWGNVHVDLHSFYGVHELDALEAIDNYDPDVVICSWPPYDDPIGYKALKASKGKLFIMIGEGYGGCTADNNFFKHYDIIDEIYIPKWRTIYDRVHIGYYKEK